MSLPAHRFQVETIPDDHYVMDIDAPYSAQVGSFDWSVSDPTVFPGYVPPEERYALSSDYRHDMFDHDDDHDEVEMMSPQSGIQSEEPKAILPTTKTLFQLNESTSIELYDHSPLPSPPSCHKMDVEEAETSQFSMGGAFDHAFGQLHTTQDLCGQLEREPSWR